MRARLARAVANERNFAKRLSVRTLTRVQLKENQMKRWIAPLGSLVAVAGVAALALFLAGVFDGSDASGSGGNGAEVAGVCVEGNPDCGDTGFVTDNDSGDTVAPGCEVGHVGACDDTPIADGETGDLFEGDGPSLQPACAPGFPDCADTQVLPDDSEGE